MLGQKNCSGNSNQVLRVLCLPSSAWADGNLAVAAAQLGKMVEQPEQPNQSKPNPGLSADESPVVKFCGHHTMEVP